MNGPLRRGDFLMRLSITTIALFALSTLNRPVPVSAGPDDSVPGLHPQVRIETSMGTFTAELDAADIPVGVTHFMDHVERGHYKGLVFHRVLKGGLIQGGSYLPTMDKRLGSKAPEGMEYSTELSNQRGTIALIQVVGRDDVPQAEFFVNISSNTGLDDQSGIVAYIPIGKITEGQEVVDRIGSVPVAANPKYAAGLSAVVPVKPVTIDDVKVLRPLDRAEAKRVVDDRTRRAEQAAAEAVTSAEQNHVRAEQALENAAKESGSKVVVTPSGLKHVDLRVGKGAQPLLQDRVVMNFRGALLNGVVLNDTFVEEKPPTKTMSGLIAGLREGVSTMAEGGRRLLLVPPDLAFGNTGIPGRVPPNAWIFYEVELLEVLPPE